MDLLWKRLIDGLEPVSSESPEAAPGARHGAVLALLSERGDDLELLLTKRSAELASHPGQIAFPGGRVDRGERIAEAALREAWEECAVDPASVEVLGQLTPFFVPPSRFWLHGVVGRWVSPHPLRRQESEVAEIFTVGLADLRDRARWRAVSRIPHTRARWAWDLGEGERSDPGGRGSRLGEGERSDPGGRGSRLGEGGRVLWGATGVLTAQLLDVAVPGWHGGADPDDLPSDRRIEPF